MSENDCCKYCGRPLWGSPVYVGGGRSRHESCAPGSLLWAEWYRNQPASQHSDAGDILYHTLHGEEKIMKIVLDNAESVRV